MCLWTFERVAKYYAFMLLFLFTGRFPGFPWDTIRHSYPAFGGEAGETFSGTAQELEYSDNWDGW